MSFRRILRDVSRKGNLEKGTVEHAALGKATVLTVSGKRYTNLPIIGTELEEGDAVAIDFSTEVPSVYLLQDIGELETSDLELGEHASSWKTIEDIDIGCCIGHEGGMYSYSPPSHHASSGIPYIWEWGYNQVEEEWLAEIWDTSQIIEDNNLRGSNYLTIPTSGKYLVFFSWAYYLYGIHADWGWIQEGYVRARLYKNDTTLVLETNRREYEHDRYRAGMITLTILDLDEGDKLSLEFLHTHPNPLGWSASYGEAHGDWTFRKYVSDGENMLVTIQLIPGTQEI
jgi:hypothetical protein